MSAGNPLTQLLLTEFISHIPLFVIPHNCPRATLEYSSANCVWAQALTAKYTLANQSEFVCNTITVPMDKQNEFICLHYALIQLSFVKIRH